MKKTVFLLVAVCVAFVANAQLSQGTVSLGGTFNYSSSSNKLHNGSTSNGSVSNSFNFGPRVGYFLSDDVSIGAALNFRSSSQPDNGWNNEGAIYKNHSLAFSPYARLHKSLGENFYIFGEGMISIGSGGSKTIEGNTTTKGNNVGIFGAYLSPGILFMPSEKFGLEMSFTGLQFESTSYTNPENSNIKTVNNVFRFGPNTFAPNIGVQYYF